MQTSLRARFALGVGAVLLPFLVAAAVGLFYLLPRLAGPMEEIVEEMVEELEPVRYVQTALLMAARPPNDYLIHGDPAKRVQFARLSGQVDWAFERIPAASFGEAEEHVMVQSAYEKWQQARRLGENLLRLRHPVGNPAAARDVERFNDHIDRVVSLLDQVHAIAHLEINESREIARAARTRSIWVTSAAFVLALAVSTFAGTALARSVLSGVDTLRAGATRLAAGELSHRVDADRGDELGELVKAFNAMAEQVETAQAKLAELATHDSLTGLINRRELMRYLKIDNLH